MFVVPPRSNLHQVLLLAGLKLQQRLLLLAGLELRQLLVPAIHRHADNL
jgi:hypothetical protein